MSEVINDCTTYNFAADELGILKKYTELALCVLAGLLSYSVVVRKIKNHLFRLQPVEQRRAVCICIFC